MSTLFVNDVEVPCKSIGHTGHPTYQEITFRVEYPIEDAKDTFVDNANLKVVWSEHDERDYSEYKLLDKIIYNGGDNLEVVYREMTPTEKLIELHYGGVN